jgi:rRNA-processing protein FCF1
MSWYFLRNGQPVENAISALDRLINEATNLSGSLNLDATVAANQYLLWTEEAERQLSALYDSQSIPRGLLTERYWRIRAMTKDTVRPQPLIRAEIADQNRVLEDLRTQLQHYQTLVGPLPEERLLICDTNVLIHGKRFHELPWNEKVSERKIRLVIPLAVLDELDKQKDEGNRDARAVLKDLDGILKPGAALERVTLRTHVTLQLTDEPASYERLRSVDDEIVRQARYFSSVSGGRITIATIDRGMRVRAEAAGINAIDLPPEYKRKPLDQQP